MQSKSHEKEEIKSSKSYRVLQTKSLKVRKQWCYADLHLLNLSLATTLKNPCHSWPKGKSRCKYQR